jgi:hypothetical protein
VGLVWFGWFGVKFYSQTQTQRDRIAHKTSRPLNLLGDYRYVDYIERVDLRLRFKIVIVVLLGIAILIPSILVYASETNTYFFSRDLQVTDFVFNGDSYIANVSDSGVLVAGLDFRIEHSVANLTSHRIQFSIWHTDSGSSQLDSMTLRFSTEPYVITLYLAASSYDWPGARFTRDNLDVVYSVPNIGGYGLGTVTLDFILDSYGQAPNLGFTADFSMHMDAFLQLTSLKANAHLYTPIPD